MNINDNNETLEMIRRIKIDTLKEVVRMCNDRKNPFHLTYELIKHRSNEYGLRED